VTGLLIDDPGPRATVQDSGRRGHQHLGLATGGAADLHGFHWANKLLDNPPGAATIEILMGGFTATATGPVTLAITGAEAPVSVNGRQTDNWASLHLQEGDRLELGRPRSGLINYLATPGGWNSTLFCESRSVVVRERIDGLAPLFRGETLHAAEHGSCDMLRIVPEAHRPDYTAPLVLALMPARQTQAFDRRDWLRLIHSDYRVTPDCNRMGYRLQGAALTSGPDGIISEGIPLGSVQVPGDGQPVVLLQDRQTLGGYPKIATIPALDCSHLAQRGPGTALRFHPCDAEDALTRRQLFELFFRNTQWKADGRRLCWR